MNKPTILIVDDEKFFRKLYVEMLEPGGYRVETCETGPQASARLAQGGVDILVTDLVMPDVDGLELLKQARASENPPEVIVATGHATLESAIAALKSGARDYLFKPFQSDELLHLVRTCLEQRRLLDENSQLKKQILLFQKAQALASLLDLEQLIAQSVSTLSLELGPATGFGYILNRESDLMVLAPPDMNQEQAKALACELAPLLNPPNSTKEFQHWGADSVQRFTHLFDGQNCLFLFTIWFQGLPKGALVLFNLPGEEILQPHPRENLCFIFEQAQLGFENAYRYHGIRELMYTDDLTGLYNHRYLHMAIDQEIRRATRYGLNFTLVFIDLDFFKNINDEHGHLAGSQALREIALLLRRSVRDVDSLFRYGGDEFTALLLETDEKTASVVAERIRRTIETHTFLAQEAINARITATVGHATYPINAKTKTELIDMADRAMYDGKKFRNVCRGISDLPT